LTEKVIARRYARALFAIGLEKGEKELQAYAKDLSQLAELLNKSPELSRIFKNPIFTAEEKKGGIRSVLDKMEPNQVIRDFCFLLADKDRLAYLTEIEDHFRVLLDKEQGVMRGEIITAVTLAKAKKENIKKKLEEQLEQSLVLNHRVDKNILGGLVLKVGDKVYDASLKAQLNMLKENIKRGE
jgi:F-type H+-transporting ATPase subunit delta